MEKTNISDTLLSACFSDETERFRSPAEPEPGDTVTVRLRAPEACVCHLLTGDGAEVPMRPAGRDGCFALYEASFPCPETPLSYRFRAEAGGVTVLCQRDGAKAPEQAEGALDFRVLPGFHTPAWAKGAVQYQIFPERFRNGDKTNDVIDGEYSYNRRHVRTIPDWLAPPETDDYRCFYGGDLAGILEKLDYLQGLGVEVLYLNPIFLAPSSHKYDTQDYEHIDPHFGVVEEDVRLPLQSWEMHNGYARTYITRVLSRRNLARSDELFARLCRELHERGMRIILDGVFNHCGSFHRWMDREGIYLDKPGYAVGAFQSEDSPYRGFFRFTEKEPGYEAWWGLETLPKLCYEDSRTLCEAIFSVAEKWLRPPYSIDGWRLDVAADLGHSPEANHAFWQEFRRRVKAVNPEALIVAEHYGDPEPWLRGNEWDSVMNYDAFMDPVTYFLTGMEKHSDGVREELYQDGAQFFAAMHKAMARMSWSSLQCAMNELSNHDHSRFLTRTNRTVGRLQTLGAAAAEKGTEKAVLREAVVIQMTWPGAPTVYYGDEAGLAGWTDPDNRRCYPWGAEDEELIELHRSLIALREREAVLRTGSLVPLGAGRGWIAYARFDGERCAAVACNNALEARTLTLDLRRAGVQDGARFVRVCRTDAVGHCDAREDAGIVTGGQLRLTLPPRSAAILRNA